MSNLAEKIVEKNADITKFPVDEHKLKKDGTFKRIPNNNTEERWVHPIREKDDIKKVSSYLLEKAKNEENQDRKEIAYRNWLLFTIGINVGLRVSDLIDLKWSHFLKSDMKTFVENINKKEKKTGKMKSICPNECIRRAINEYLDATGVKPKRNQYMFLNMRTGERITDAVVEKLIKDFSEKCELDGNYNTHSLRKTYAYQKYMLYVENGDPLALVKVQKDLNHRNSSDTARYLGITKEEQFNSSMQLGDYLMDCIAF